MHSRLREHLIVILFGALAGAAAAQTPPARPKAEPGSTEILADHISGQTDVETVAEGHAELQRDDLTVDADRMVYRPLEDELEATGDVRLKRRDDRISGPHLRMKVQDNLGVFEEPHYSFTRVPATRGLLDLPRKPVTGSGEARSLDFEGDGLYRLDKGTFSTCSPNRDWYVDADELTLNYNRELGEGKGATVVFKDVPILYSPWFSFPLNERRKSGLLAPSYGTSTTSGLELTVPWYWNIAPNMDATISPRVLSRRGIQMNSEFRYLEYAYRGQAHFEYLPSDRLTGTDRFAYAFLHDQTFAPGLTGNLNVNGVSDDTYFADLSSRVAMVSQANLLRQGSLTYAQSWWSAMLMVQRYQTLQDPAAPVAIPYQKAPQLLVTALRPDLPAGLNFSFSGEYVNFEHPTQVTAERAVLYPQVSLPMQTAAFFLTPKVGVHLTRYSLSGQTADTPGQVSREVPISSLDTGFTMERDTEWAGKSVIQTLEPRLYYVYVPNRDQSRIPVFDSGLMDFNFAQIFSENRYAGSDRIGDANQLTSAITSRLIDPANGAEVLRGAIGQRFYFRDQEVTLPGEVPRTNRKTDLLAAFSGLLAPRLHLDVGWQYSPFFSRTEVANAGLRYSPEFGKVANVGYRYTRDQIGEVDLSIQWPLFRGWYAVGRYDYSVKDKRLVEGVAGLEYDGGCWVARMAFHRLATTTATTSTSFFIQLELNGLASIGTNPIELLKRNIAGYGVINQPTADPIFGAY